MKLIIYTILVLVTLVTGVLIIGLIQDYNNSLDRCTRYDASNQYWGYECKSGTVYTEKRL